MFNDYIGWHIELTRRCPLRCPGCERTLRFDQIPDPRLDIDPEGLMRFFPRENNHNIRYLFLQGNLGDPIYHPDFHSIAEHFFNCDLLMVTTNGMQSVDFWKRVLETWPENSTVELSIDGLIDTNHIYRVNSNWNRIEELFDLISTVNRKCRIQWKYILFDHNRHQVDQAQLLSKKLGMDSFRIQKSRIFDHPTIRQHHDSRYFRDEVEFLDGLDPFCLTGDMHYITAGGEYFPCCWWADQNMQEGLWDPPIIYQHTINEIKAFFLDFTEKNLKDHWLAPDVCQRFCRKKCEGTAVPNTQLYRKIMSNDTR